MSAIIDDLRKERERFVAFAFAAAEIFFEVDAAGTILFEGGAVEKVGPKRDGASLIGKPIYDVIDEDDRDVFVALKMHLEHKGRLGPIPIRFISSLGHNFALRLFGLHMPGENSRTFLALRSAPLGGGVSEQSVDKETGLLTRDSFLDLAANTMAENTAHNSLYVTAVEIDGLDEAQKKFGPKFAHNLLGQMAAQLKTLSLDGEMASQIGDKHFAFLHRTQGDGEYIGESLKKVDNKVQLKTSVSTISADNENISEGQILRTLSYVLSKFCEDSTSVDFDQLTAAYDTMAVEAQARVTSMRSMIESGSFKMAFQPVVSLKSGDIHHNEVLSRFEGGLDADSPKDIIEFAENVGMIEEFDIALCKKAIDYIRKMKGLGEPLTLSVNLSGRTLESGRFVDEFVSLLIGAKDVARYILLELTETKAISNMEKAEAILNDLKACGYRLCLDDFGVGASGYQYLRSFNVDYVKINGSYVCDMDKPGYKPTFLLSIVRLCHDLDIKTIGQHIETSFQADFLKSLGVDFGQGYYYGRPDFSPKTDR